MADWSIAFADSDPEPTEFLGIPVRSENAIAPGDHFVIAIGSGEARQKVEDRLLKVGAKAHPCHAPTAIVGPGVVLGGGEVLSDNTLLTSNLSIGKQFQCNIYSYVAHDCVIGDYVTFAPRVSCNGNVVIGDYAYIGTGAVLRQGSRDKPLRIGAGAVVGMGAVVTKDVPDGAVVVGNPARPLDR